LEAPPGQPNGSRINSTMSAGKVTMATTPSNVAGIILRFVMGIQQTGNLRFYIIVEAMP
jgi:hypothetical protein